MATTLERPRAGFLPIAEAAERLGISRSSAVRRFRAGRLRGYQDPDSGYIYVAEDSVDEVLQRLEILRAGARLPGDRQLDERYRPPADETA